ncbi:glycosyl hydrolase family 88-domain-containing protein [Amylocystis lapponica]|nr:glycosyl hydrolase family 88-domain-containing protein [Amylocystis lapponica]
MRRHRPRRVLAALLLVVSSALGQNLTTDQISTVVAVLKQGAQQTWELGTECQALTEYDAPAYSVLNDFTLPPSHNTSTADLDPVLSIARAVVANRSISNNETVGPQPLMYVPGGAAGDPASIGVAVLLANWTNLGASDGHDYAGAARDQLDYLFLNVPHTDDGAISHRVEQVQLWADNVYMVPPFLAYYGVTTANQSLLSEAYNQIKLYRSYLYDSGPGLWRHITLGSGVDTGHWSTGNGWAAAGMLRVLGTIQHSEYASSMKNEMKDLVKWVSEIHDGMYSQRTSGYVFTNYVDDDSSFLDGSSTALLASTVYRLALLAGVHTHVPRAELVRQALFSPNPDPSAASSSSSDSTSDSLSSASSTSSSAPSTSSSAPASSSSSVPSPPGSLAHFSNGMWLTPVVDPYDWNQSGSNSPEGQAFVVELYSAWRDWAAAGAPGVNAGTRLSVGAPAWAVLLVVVGWGVL